MEPATATALLERAPAAGQAVGGAGGGLAEMPGTGDIALPGGGDDQGGGAQVPAGDGLSDAGSRAVLGGLAAVAGLGLLPLILIMLGVAVVIAFMEALNPFDGGDGTFTTAWPKSSGIPAVYMPMYEAASQRFGVNKFLIASVHQQETNFSRNPAARSGFNSSGAAGPMQFLLSTWAGHNKAFKAIEKARPASYPLNRRLLPSCLGVPPDLGCVYDDFDAIAGAAHKLRADGASQDLNSAGTRRAVCAYIGACSEVDACTGSINQYCQVLPRAKKWQLEAGAVPAGGPAAQKAVAWALTQEGVVESPVGSDCGGPIGGWQRRAGSVCGTAWCGVFVHEAFLRAGIDLPNWVIGVQMTLEKARAGEGGMKIVPKNQIKRGDIVIFQWDSGNADHMGLAAADYTGGKLATIEGNTSHGVHRRSQPQSVIVAGVRVVKGGG